MPVGEFMPKRIVDLKRRTNKKANGEKKSTNTLVKEAKRNFMGYIFGRVRFTEKPFIRHILYYIIIA